MLVDDISELETGLQYGIPYSPNPSSRNEILLFSQSYNGQHMNIYLMLPIPVFETYRYEISQYIGLDNWNDKHIQLYLYRIDNNIINCDDFYVTLLVNKWEGYLNSEGYYSPATIWLSSKQDVDLNAECAYLKRDEQHFEILEDLDWNYFVQRVKDMEVRL